MNFCNESDRIDIIYIYYKHYSLVPLNYLYLSKLGRAGQRDKLDRKYLLKIKFGLV